MPLTQEKSATTHATNRRASPRRQATLGTVCRVSFGKEPTPHLGLVWNLSSMGVSMLLNEPPETGSLLHGELATTDDRNALAVTLRVVHVRPIRTGDFFLGAQFEQTLAPSEMRPFLAEPNQES